MKWRIEQPGIIVYEDGLRVDIESMHFFLDQPVGTMIVHPDGTRTECLGRRGDALVFRTLLPEPRDTDA